MNTFDNPVNPQVVVDAVKYRWANSQGWIDAYHWDHASKLATRAAAEFENDTSFFVPQKWIDQVQDFIAANPHVRAYECPLDLNIVDFHNQRVLKLVRHEPDYNMLVVNLGVYRDGQMFFGAKIGQRFWLVSTSNNTRLAYWDMKYQQTDSLENLD
ncbi:hypothetical protein [Sinorhizobium sp. BG8]|uniref:hypothetical protein n=1 Tax=Sinorhizobium sp. BG8 TaxID=2613773 RepID=UPI00193DC97D|nr:hypothetical protein [Sinorhizobium sp. BG8]QRM54733.1 hypothetical protein F3Y30_09395 [Sinorhizobium sp. BG8]